jgi:hypothetical protein
MLSCWSLSCVAEPCDWSFSGATRNPREWISLLEADGRQILSFLLWTDFETWKQRLLTKAPAGDPGAEQYFRLFERDEWRQFPGAAGIQEELIDTTMSSAEEVADHITRRVMERT